MAKADFEIIDTGSDERDALIRLKILDSAITGHDAVFTLESKVTVKDKSPVHGTKRLFEHRFKLADGQREYDIRVPAGKLETFTYQGNQLDIELITRLKVDDSLLFDSKIEEHHELPLVDKPKVNNNTKNIIEPKDLFRFFANLKAIPFHNQMITLLLVVVGGVVMLVNAVIGIHDQFVPEAATWLYSHYSSDGESNSPLAAGLVGSGVLGAVIWYLMKGQLRKYMKLRWLTLPEKLNPGVRYPVAKFFSGKARVPLENVTLRIVASNLECGQYRRRRGSKTVTVSFREPVRGVVLFEKMIANIPAGIPIDRYFGSDDFSFDEMFAVLYPPNMISKTHGLDVYWEMQLMHPEFVDHELQGPKGRFSYEDFLRDELSFEI